MAQQNPPPYLSIAPRSLAPVVLTCEHASRRLPEGLRPTGAEREMLRTHWGLDIGAWALTRELARRLGTGAVGGRWSRLWIDLNRPVDDLMLARTCADGSPLSWNDPLPPKEVERRVLNYHVPYHAEVDRLIFRRLVRGIRPLLFAIHTFTDELRGRRRRFDVGILYDRYGGPARRLAQTLRDAGLEVRYNQPYSGRRGLMYSVERHGSHHRLPCLELEVKQSLFDRAANLNRLSRVVERGVRRLIETR